MTRPRKPVVDANPATAFCLPETSDSKALEELLAKLERVK
jgi:hypothetical protein